LTNGEQFPDRCAFATIPILCATEQQTSQRFLQ
jgi:hypothetical protein